VRVRSRGPAGYSAWAYAFYTHLRLHLLSLRFIQGSILCTV
jgi:hypothetical protein